MKKKIILMHSLEEISLFNNKTGIYGLMYEGEIIYIGQSKNIGDRLKHHFGKNALQQELNKVEKENGNINRTKLIALYLFINKHYEGMQFLVLKECNEKDLDKEEGYYIEKFRPRFNYKGCLIPYNAKIETTFWKEEEMKELYKRLECKVQTIEF